MLSGAQVRGPGQALHDWSTCLHILSGWIPEISDSKIVRKVDRSLRDQLVANMGSIDDVEHGWLNSFWAFWKRRSVSDTLG